ncbi:MAG: DUF2203 domain-containing protein [Chloroflexi bacterium]|nr:DUF2203 domain-containing protein [Chloroflexota bacterium]
MASLFTLEEAEALLPRLVPLVTQLRELKLKHDGLQETAARLGRRSQTNGHAVSDDLQRSRQEVSSTTEAINGLIEEIASLGCEVKDIGLGLLDFRTLLDGEEVYLCWKSGESRIEWWHELNTGYSSRKPLP